MSRCFGRSQSGIVANMSWVLITGLICYLLCYIYFGFILFDLMLSLPTGGGKMQCGEILMIVQYIDSNAGELLE